MIFSIERLHGIVDGIARRVVGDFLDFCEENIYEKYTYPIINYIHRSTSFSVFPRKASRTDAASYRNKQASYASIEFFQIVIARKL